MAGGQVGGNGSVVWDVNHRPGKGPFTCRSGTGPIEANELRTNPTAPEVMGRHPKTIASLNNPPSDVYPEEARALAKPGRFFVRLRFDGPEGDAIRKWALSADAPKDVVGVYTEQRATILVINVLPIARRWSDKDWADMPWEIRYDW